MFFSHDKSVGTMFYFIFLTKRTWPVTLHIYFISLRGDSMSTSAGFLIIIQFNRPYLLLSPVAVLPLSLRLTLSRAHTPTSDADSDRSRWIILSKQGSLLGKLWQMRRVVINARCDIFHRNEITNCPHKVVSKCSYSIRLPFLQAKMGISVLKKT